MISCRHILQSRRRELGKSRWIRPLVSLDYLQNARFISSSSAVARETGKKETEDELVDVTPIVAKNLRLPSLSTEESDFPNNERERAWYRKQSTMRILRIAADRIAQPPTLHLFVASAVCTVGIAAVEGTILCQQWPFLESLDAAKFVFKYSIEQLIPSIVWNTQDATLVVKSLGMDPSEVLRTLNGREDANDASTMLLINSLATTRYFTAGFMMIAQLVRAASLSAGASEEYSDGIVKGNEPPVEGDGLVIRLCGRDSFTSEVSMQRMGFHFFPVFEDPERVQHLVWKHSDNLTRPVYWRVRPERYGSSYAWDRFPSSSTCFLKGVNGEKILVLEADATNANDPLALSEAALDLNLDEASQGFRRIQERFHDTSKRKKDATDFQTLRVYLGNSMETRKSGGGHSYTLRHRVRYAKEVDVLIDSRAPVLNQILEWCHRVAGKHKKIFFQTSSREYFLNLQKLLKAYGYEIIDPLDLRKLDKMRDGNLSENDDDTKNSLLRVLLDDPSLIDDDAWEYKEFLEEFDEQNQKASKSKMLQEVTKMAKLPRLLHMKTSAETVNAAEALIMAGEVDASNCCALIDRQESVSVLENVLKERSKLIRKRKWEWFKEEESTTGNDVHENPDEKITETKNGLQIICTSTIYDGLFQQVRMWARKGYSAAEIQKEMDVKYDELLTKSHEVQKEAKLDAEQDLSTENAEQTHPQSLEDEQGEKS